MVRLTVEIEGAEELQHRLAEIDRRISDLTPIWGAITSKLFDIEREIFDSEGRGQWAPLSPRYAAWKARHYPGQPLLVLTGAMRQAFTNSSGAEIVRQPQSLLVKWSTPEYAKYHQTGTTYMPARPVLVVERQDVEAIAEVARDEIRKLINGA